MTMRIHRQIPTVCGFSVLFVGSTDRLIRIYDLSLVGSEQESDEAEDGPPELLFVHGGHGGGVSDFDWNPLKDIFTETPVRVAHLAIRASFLFCSLRMTLLKVHLLDSDLPGFPAMCLDVRA